MFYSFTDIAPFSVLQRKCMVRWGTKGSGRTIREQSHHSVGSSCGTVLGQALCEAGANWSMKISMRGAPACARQQLGRCSRPAKAAVAFPRLLHPPALPSMPVSTANSRSPPLQHGTMLPG